MIDKTIGIIGCGNMGEALLKGLSRVVEKSTKLIVSEGDAVRRAHIQETYRIIPAPDNRQLLGRAGVVILAVKPQDLDAVLREDIRCGLSGEKLLVSIAAGVTTGHIEGILGMEVPVIRAMPNLPATVGAGVTGLAAGRHATPADMALAAEIFSTVGDVVEVPEDRMDALTATSGSGPAYFFYLVEALAAAGVALGLDEETARVLAAKTAVGSARLLESSGEGPAALRKRVTSKGGTTEAACGVLDAKGFREIMKEATAAAARRAKELTKT